MKYVQIALICMQMQMLMRNADVDADAGAAMKDEANVKSTCCQAQTKTEEQLQFRTVLCILSAWNAIEKMPGILWAQCCCYYCLLHKYVQHLSSYFK